MQFKSSQHVSKLANPPFSLCYFDCLFLFRFPQSSSQPQASGGGGPGAGPGGSQGFEDDGEDDLYS